jgi:hypothetical protein
LTKNQGERNLRPISNFSVGYSYEIRGQTLVDNVPYCCNNNRE